MKRLTMTQQAKVSARMTGKSKTGTPQVEPLKGGMTPLGLPTATAPAPAPKVLRPVCPATKKDGTPCTARCAEGKVTCVDHQPAWDRLTHDEHVAFGHWLRKARAKDVVEVIGWWKAKQIAADMGNGWAVEKLTPAPMLVDGQRA